MQYTEVKQALREASLQLQSKRTEKANFEAQIRNIRGRSDSIVDEMNASIEKAKGEKLKEEEDKIAKPFKDKLLKLGERKAKLKATYDKNMNSINFNSYREDYEEELTIIGNAKDSINEIQETTKNVLGDRLGEALFKRLDNSKVELSVDDISELTKRLTKFQTNIDMLSRRSDRNYMEMFEEVLKKINPCKDESKEGSLQNDVFIYTGICAGLSFLTVNFLSPYLVLGLFGLAGFNMYRTYAIYRLTLESKLLTDNIDAINSMVENSINEDMQEDREELDRIYNKKVKSIDQQIAHQEELLNDKILEVRDSFEFNDDYIRQKYDMTKSNLREEAKRAENSITQIEFEISKIQKTINELTKQLNSLSEGLADYYLDVNRYGTEFILDNKFLIDMENNEPVFWKFPHTSCLVIYDSEEEVTEFVKLISVQLLNRLNPCALSIDYWDIKNLGMNMQCFNYLAKNLYNICGETKEVEESLSSISEVLKKRGPTIRREHNDILEYNQYMLDMESVPESYNFLFCINVNSRVFEKEEMERLLLKGSEVGLYPIIFLSLEELKELKQTGEKLLDACCNTYNLSGGRIVNRAKRFYQKILEDSKSKSPI